MKLWGAMRETAMLSRAHRVLFYRGFFLVVVLLTLALGLSFSSAVTSPLAQFNATPDNLFLNWTNSNRQNITLAVNSTYTGTVTLQIHTSNTGLSGNYSQRNHYQNSTTNSKYWDSCFYTNSDLDNPLVAINQTGSVYNLTGSMSNISSLVFTILHNTTCPPGRYSGPLTISNTTNTADQVNLSVQVDVPIDSTNTLNTTTGASDFKGTLLASANTYHSYHFNTSSITNATGIVVNLTWSSSSKDLDLFLVDNTGSLKSKSISKNQSTEQLNFNYLSSGQVWEIRVYGNVSSAENYTGNLFFTTLNLTNTTTQVSSIDFGTRNVSQTSQINLTLKNEGQINGSLISEIKEIYHTEAFSSSGSGNFTFLVPSFATKVRVSVNWTGGTNYTLKLYEPGNTLAGSSSDKYRTANVSGVEQEEFVETTTITSSPNLWRAEVLNASGADSYTLDARFYVAETGWLASNYSTTSFSPTQSQTHQVNLTVPSTAVSGLYKGALKYQNNQTISVSFQVNATTPTIVVNNTYSSGTTRASENIGFNRSGASVFQITVPINNTGNQLMSLTSTNSTNLTKGSNFMTFVYSIPSTINAGSSDNLRINVTINTSNTGNSQGIYSGWIFLNGSAAPYQGFNLTIEMNLTSYITGTTTHSPSMIFPNQTNNITFTVNVTLLNGSSISNNLNLGNFTSVTITEKNVSTYVQNLTNILNNSATVCTGTVCTFNATVPAGLVGGRYKVTVYFNATAEDGSVLTGSAVNATTLIINETGLNLSALTSTSLGNLNEAATTTFSIIATNYGPKTADDVNISFNKGSCSISPNTPSNAVTGGSSVSSSGNGFAIADIPESGSVNLTWTLTGSTVTADSSCSDASVTVNQQSFNNITGISLTVKDVPSSSTTTGATGGAAGSTAGSTSTGSSLFESLTITDSEDKIEIVQGQSKTTTVKVKNIGDVSLEVTFSIEDLDKKISYSVAGSGTIVDKVEEPYILEFTIPADMKVGEYTGKFKIVSGSVSDTEDFIIVVLPSQESKVVIEDYNKIYEKLLKSLTERHSNVKTLCSLPALNPLSTLNTLERLQTIDKLFTEASDVLVQLSSALKDDDYLRSQKHADSLKEKTDKLDSLLKDLEEYKTTCLAIANQNSSSMFFYGGIGSIVVVFAGLLIYSYFPIRRGYLPGRGFSTTKPRPNVFRAVGRSVKGLGNFFRKEEGIIAGDLKGFEKAISKEYSATSGYLRREISYEFEQASAWVKFKNKLGNAFKFGKIRPRGPF